MNATYREFVIKTVLFLEDVNGNLFTKIMNLASNNEFPNLKEDFEATDNYYFDIRFFNKSKDSNLLRLLKLYSKVQKHKRKLIKSNKITTEELEHYFLCSEFGPSFSDAKDEDDEMLFDFKTFLN